MLPGPVRAPAENRKSGGKPERYRHCKRQGPPRDESQPLGRVFLRRRAGAGEARVRRPAWARRPAVRRIPGGGLVCCTRKTAAAVGTTAAALLFTRIGECEKPVKLLLSGLEHSQVPIALREGLSFPKNRVRELDRALGELPGVSGCVLLSTCNRTELYVTSEEGLDPGRLLCQAAGVPYGPYRAAFASLSGEAAARHLLEVAAGLRSRIWGEDQIISQVKDAITLGREAGAADPLLETLFRCAIAAGKEVRARVRITQVPVSAASRAVELLQRELGGLGGKRAVVIGNGEMGRLSAALLCQAGCRVTVTLRSYRHGETIVPAGCQVVPYEERFPAMDGADLLVSATASPHYTVTAAQLAALAKPPALVVDLAIPRDVEPGAGGLTGVRLYNIDDFGDLDTARQTPPEVEAILQAQMDNFTRWLRYRDCLPGVPGLKEALAGRVLALRELGEALDQEELVRLAVGKTVDLLVSGLAGRLRPEDLARCEEKVRRRAAHRPAVGAAIPQGRDRHG